MSRQQKRRPAGFTLIEVIVSLSAFTIIMLGIVAIFGSAFVSYRETRSLQHNLESAQFAMNTMAKELRTSSIVSVPTTNPLNVHFIDYSQNGGRGACITYWVDTTTSEFKKWVHPMSSDNPNTNRTNCAGLTFGSGDYVGVLVQDVTDSQISAIPSDDSPRTVGRVTVRLRIGTTVNNQTIQSSVSLRDFNFIDI